VPVTVYDGEQLQDGGVYLARPAPLAVEGGVEYILQRDGARIGLFDIDSAAQQQGSWIGFGTWKQMPAPKLAAPARVAPIDDEGSDRPVLHRKHPADSGSSSDSGDKAPAPDPDRPQLHKKPDSSDTDSTTAGSAPPPDPDRPQLHKAPGSSDDSSQTTASTSSDPDRPQLKKGKPKQELDEGYVSSVPDATDPDRPRLARGKSSFGGPSVLPTLVGLPEDMEQTVAVSDPRNRPEHPWNYSWANPADELKMKGALEDTARTALGINAAPQAATAKPRTSAAAHAKAKPAPAPAPQELAGEQFRVFELAYGSGATLVLTAHTDGPAAQQKFVTLIAQPDLYGGERVLFKSVTDGGHLDDTPRMRLIDAVDALADNRGELLFELRGTTERQFALYRVLRGSAEKLFVTGGDSIGTQAMN
jgi:hypothetical protein